MSVCGDFGGVTAKGEPCRRGTNGLCPAHREQDPRPGGRPTAYDADAACATVMALGVQGASRAEWAAELGICFKTMRNWEDEHPEFLQATTRAEHLSQAWWERQGRLGIWSRDFNASAYRLQVMNRFPADWRDKQNHEVTGRDGGPMEVETHDVRERFTRRITGIASRVGAGSGHNGAQRNGDSGA